MEPEKQEKRPLTEEEKLKLEKAENTLKGIINMCDGFLTSMGAVSGEIGHKNFDGINKRMGELIDNIEKQGSKSNGENKDRIIERIGKLGETFKGNKTLEKILSGRFQRPNK